MTNLLASSHSTLTPPLIASQFPIAAQSLLPFAIIEAQAFALHVQPSSPVHAWFTDMDGTIFNGKAPPDPHSAAVLHHLTHNLTASNIPVIYVTGRYIGSIRKVIATYGLPTPTYVAAATGTMIYERFGDDWKEVNAYTEELRSHWVERPDEIFDGIMAKLGVSNWRPRFREELRHIYISGAEGRTYEHQLRINELLIESGLNTVKVVVSGPGNEGFLNYDFVPDNGSKLYAARFIAQKLLGFNDLSTILFTGDSGNDVDLLLAAGFATLVRSTEEGLSDLLRSQRADIHLSPYDRIYGVLHGMIAAGCLRLTPVSSALQETNFREGVTTILGAGWNPLRALNAAYRDLSVMQSVLRAAASNLEMANRLQTSGVRPTLDRLVRPMHVLESSVAYPAYEAALHLFQLLRTAAAPAREGAHLQTVSDVFAAANRLKSLVSGQYAQISRIAEGLKVVSDFSHEPLSQLHAALGKKGFKGPLEEQINQIMTGFETLQKDFLKLDEADYRIVVESLRRVSTSVRDAHETMPLAQALAFQGIRDFAKVAFTDNSRPMILPAPVAWINDPVGIHVNRQDELVIYHQLNPFAVDPNRRTRASWDHMHYGKYVIDLKTGHAKIMPPVMAPMPSMDEDHCFSGSRYVTQGGKVGLWYTSIGPLNGFPDAAVQRVAWAKDLDETWFIQESIPVLTEDAHPVGLKIYEWRDPKLFDHGGQTYMLLGGALHPRVDRRVADTLLEGALACTVNQGAVIAFYMATNNTATTWKYAGLLLKEHDVTLIECPNIIDIEGKQMLLYYPNILGQRHSLYRLGHLHADAGTFETEVTGLIDHGDVFAPTLFEGPGGLPMVMGWVKVDLYRRDWNDAFLEGRGWSGCFTSPRLLEVRDGKLWQTPVIPEGLRGASWTQEELVLDRTTFNAPLQGRAARIQATLALDGDCREAGLAVRCDIEGHGGVNIVFDGRELMVEEKRVPMQA
ncbi:MAG: HAD-IIB family hydrolase [Pseudomonadota bacterium]